MLLIEVSLDKISSQTFPGLRAWLEEMNTYREKPVSVVMAVEDDNAQGVMVYAEGHLIYLYVVEACRQSGVGTFLVNYLKQKSDRGRMQCRVFPTAVPAICFFHKLGWQIDRWYIASDSRRYFRMTNSSLVPKYTPVEEEHLGEFIKNVPIFLSMADKFY